MQQIFIALGETLEEFDPDVHRRHDARVLKIELLEKEGELCKLFLEATNLEPFEKKSWCIASTTTHDGEHIVLFRGQMHGVPEKITDKSFWLSFAAHSLKTPDDKKKILEQHKKGPFYEPLLIPKSKENSPEIACLTQPKFFHTDRRTLKTALCNQTQGLQTYKVTDDILSLEVHKGTPPINRLNVTLSAEWNQYKCGFIDLSRLILSKFRNGLIPSFSKKALERAWPRKGQNIGRAGYWVNKAQLDEVTSPEEQTAFEHPEHRGKQKSFIQKSFFRALLSVGWEKSQKRREELFFTIKSPTTHTDGETKNVHVTLKRRLSKLSSKPFWSPYTQYTAGKEVQHDGDIFECTESHTSGIFFSLDAAGWKNISEPNTQPLLPSENSFFTTNRGNKAVGCAIDAANVLVLESLRFQHINIKLPLPWTHKLSVTDCIEVSHHNLHQKSITAKIISIHLCVSGSSEKNFLKVCGAIIPTAFKTQQIPEANTPGYCEIYSEEYTADPNKTLQSPGGISYKNYEDQQPSSNMKIPNPRLCSVSASGPQTHHKKLDTKLDIFFPSLSGEGCLTHKIKVAHEIFAHAPN